MNTLLIKTSLWIIEKLCKKPDNKIAALVLSTAGKLLEYPHQTIYYKDGRPLRFDR